MGNVMMFPLLILSFPYLDKIIMTSSLKKFKISLVEMHTMLLLTVCCSYITSLVTSF